MDQLTDGRQRVRLALWALGVAVAYYVGTKVGFALTPQPQPVSTLWPPNAILLGALLLLPVREWPIVILAAFPAHLAGELGSGVPLPMVLSWFVSNSAEALIGAAGVRSFIKRPVHFDSFGRVWVFLLFAAFLAPFLSSFLDAAFVMWNAWGHDSYWELWRVRFFSNVLSILTLVPVIVTWGTTGLSGFKAMPGRRFVEAAALGVSLLTVCTLVFERPALGARVTPALLYAPLPFLLWAAVRFGKGGASASLLIFALTSVWGAIHGQGPFVGHSIAENVVALQLFLIVTYIPLMVLAAVIRERARAEEQARRTEEWLNLALGAAQIGVWDWDPRARQGTWSGSTLEMAGLRDEHGNVDAQAFLEAVVPDDRARVQSAIAQAIKGPGAYEVEFRTARSGGAIRWLLGKGTVFRDKVGHAVRMLGVTTDITERKLAEEVAREETALRESEARLRDLADAMPQIVFTAGPDGSIDYFNRRWYQLTGGIKEERLRDEMWVDALHPADRVGCLESWRADVRAGRPHEHEGRFWSARDGRYRWHLARALPVRNEQGTITRWYGTATDIDDRRRAEQQLRESEYNLRVLRNRLEVRVSERTLELSRANTALRQEISVRTQAETKLRASEERFAKAFRASLDAIAIATEPGWILEINDQWESMFGYSREEAIGRTIEQLEMFYREEDRDRFMQLLTSNGFVRELEFDVRHKTGTQLQAIVSAETVDVGGQACLIMMLRDITERRRAEHEVVVQRRELAHLGRVALLGELSGALAHELNQPLAAILANARAAQRMLARDHANGNGANGDNGANGAGDNRAELRAILDDIVSDDRRAGEVIRRVRALIRKDEIELQSVAVNEAVSDVLELAHSDLIQRGVTVSTRLSATLPPVIGDRVQLQQVLLNLIVNACDAMVENPPNERRVVIISAATDDSVQVSVSDNGTGINRDPIDSVFQPFVTSKRQGLGLGLAICRSIVDAHGGRMWATNNHGRGATFHLELPRVPAAEIGGLEVPSVTSASAS